MSWIEVIVVVLIVFVLLALSIPFVRNMRELTRRSNCEQNLVRLAMAIQAYSTDNDHLPSGTATFNATFLEWPEAGSELAGTPTAEIEISSEPDGYHHSWSIAVLPHLDQIGLFQSVDQDASIYAESNRLIRETTVPVFRCPADDSTLMHSSYAGLHDSTDTPIGSLDDGLLFANSWVSKDGVIDGLSTTILLGEKRSSPDGLGWTSGTRATLRNAGEAINADETISGLGSLHFGGANVAKGDGSVTFLSQTIDQTIYRAMVKRNDKQTMPPTAPSE
ncbi:DUF1559 family PulG-like putative transporter [Rhodopirellula halodulae]|uniref:DUF1559 family PulG-like putative transporter n=1 Tax=Rhodopirellula halodulae TaxID=2894198 RepID=UPI001E3F981A|nr:DUF1559 domain-containing protein [Rhodopirellula sp. JC737]MCC9658585.1 DUF1559 domain-containing protein [Rhodopirellula sp. JC737]